MQPGYKRLSFSINFCVVIPDHYQPARATSLIRPDSRLLDGTSNFVELPPHLPKSL